MSVVPRILTVLTLAALWTAASAVPTATGGSPDATADLMKELADLVGKNGIVSNEDLPNHLSTALRDQNLQAMLRTALEADSLIGDADAQGLPSRSGHPFLQLLSLSVVGTVALVVAGMILLARIVFALGVLIDARRLVSEKIPTLFMGPSMWAMAVLIGGLLVVVTYWLVHHSKLSGIRRNEQ